MWSDCWLARRGRQAAHNQSAAAYCLLSKLTSGHMLLTYLKKMKLSLAYVMQFGSSSLPSSQLVVGMSYVVSTPQLIGVYE